MIGTPSQADLYQNGFVAGVHAAKRKVTPIAKYVNGSAAIATKQAMSSGADVIFIAREGSSEDVFSAIVARNAAKKKLSSYKEVGMISLEPDQYVSVTAATKKFLYATIVKRVDVAMYDVITMALSDKQYLDFLDPIVGIYGHRYGLADGGITLTTYLPALTAASEQINTAAVQGSKLAS
jgi:basic membrane protein A